MARSLQTQRRWFPQGQPQTLQISAMLLYFNAFIALLTALLAGGNATLYLLLVAADAVGAYGIANERKWGYKVAIVAAILPFVLLIAIAGSVLAGGIINLLFEVALVALLLHPMSRSYYKIWFR